MTDNTPTFEALVDGVDIDVAGLRFHGLPESPLDYQRTAEACAKHTFDTLVGLAEKHNVDLSIYNGRNRAGDRVIYIVGKPEHVAAVRNGARKAIDDGPITVIEDYEPTEEERRVVIRRRFERREEVGDAGGLLIEDHRDVGGTPLYDEWLERESDAILQAHQSFDDDPEPTPIRRILERMLLDLPYRSCTTRQWQAIDREAQRIGLNRVLGRPVGVLGDEPTVDTKLPGELDPDGNHVLIPLMFHYFAMQRPVPVHVRCRAYFKLTGVEEPEIRIVDVPLQMFAELDCIIAGDASNTADVLPAREAVTATVRTFVEGFKEGLSEEEAVRIAQVDDKIKGAPW
jgi:hypothetical protein